MRWAQFRHGRSRLACHGRRNGSNKANGDVIMLPTQGRQPIRPSRLDDHLLAVAAADHPQLGRSVPRASRWAEYTTNSSLPDRNTTSISW